MSTCILTLRITAPKGQLTKHFFGRVEDRANKINEADQIPDVAFSIEDSKDGPMTKIITVPFGERSRAYLEAVAQRAGYIGEDMGLSDVGIRIVEPETETSKMHKPLPVNAFRADQRLAVLGACSGVAFYNPDHLAALEEATRQTPRH